MSEGFEDICSKMSQAWFPVNPLVLSRVRSKLASGMVKGPGIIEELKSDASLFIYAIKELSRRVHLLDENRIIDPIRALENASPDTIQSILSRKASDISCHAFESIKTFQAKVLMSSIVSAVTTASLAESLDLNANTAYACALLRQLGLALIAFNYPHVYSNAIKRGDSRDAYLSMVLGFSPSLLGFTIARKWGITPLIRRGMGDTSCFDGEDDAYAAQAGETLEKICLVGEVVARIDRSKEPLIPISDWYEAKEQIRLCLGNDGFSLLARKIAESAKYYIFSAPELFILPDLAGGSTPPAASQRPIIDRNPFIRGCSSRLQERLSKLYDQMVGSIKHPANAEFLLRTIIPEAGFNAGCVFLVDTETHMLMPRLAVGESNLGEFKAIRYSTAENRSNPLVRAFMASTPIIGERKRSDEKLVSFVASSIGFLQRAGVLYLEAAAPPGSDEGFFSDRHRTECKAIRQALSDCLNLE